MRSFVALLLPLAARADDRDVSRPAFTWSEDNAKLYLNIFWSKTLDRAKEDDSSLFGESGYDHGIQPMDEVEVFFDTQRLELFAFNAKEGYHLDIPLRNRIVVPESTWKTREENDGIDIVMKKTRVGAARRGRFDGVNELPRRASRHPEGAGGRPPTRASRKPCLRDSARVDGPASSSVDFTRHL